MAHTHNNKSCVVDLVLTVCKWLHNDNIYLQLQVHDFCPEVVTSHVANLSVQTESILN